MLFFYPSSGKKTEYTGNRRLEALKGWVERVMKPVFLDMQYADFAQVVNDNSALFLALHPLSVSPPPSLSQAARSLMGSPPIYISSAPELFDRFSIPVEHDAFTLIALKDGDSSAAAQLLFSSQTSARDLDKWLQVHRWPSALELGEGSFQEVMNAESKPLVVLVSVTDSGAERDHIVATVRKLATQWRKTGAVQYAPAHEARQVVFTWMDQDRWAKWLKSMYGINGPTQVVITDHSRLVYYDQTRAGNRLTLDDTSILLALGDAMRGALSVRHSENIIERVARFINKKFIAVEGMVSEHPWVTVAFFVLGAFVVFFVIKRLFLDEENYAPQIRGRKEARLD